jgi:PAS domain S-box-containing protein
MMDQQITRSPAGAKPTPDPLAQDEIILRQALTHSAPSATYVARLDTTASNLFVSPEIDRLLDLKPNESISDPNFWFNHLHPDDRDFVMSEITRQQESERPIHLRYRMLTGTGEIRTIRDEAFIVRDAQGRPIFLQGILYDITSLQEAESALTQTFDRLRFLESIIEKSPTMVFRWHRDEAETVEFVTENVSQLGYSAADLLEGRVRWPSLIYPPDLPRRAQECQAFLQNGNDEFVLQYRLIAHSGDLRWFEDRSRIIRDQQGRPTHIEGLLVDITDRKNAQLLLQESEEQYRQLSRRLQTIREDESTRISRVIHDDLGQSLSVLKMDTVRLHRRMEVSQPDLQNITTAMLEMIDRALFTTQRIAMDLHPGILDDLGLAPAIEWYVQQMQPHTEVCLSQTVEPPDLTVPPAITLSLFRILQEAVTNTLRHAEASTLVIHLSGYDAGYRLLIEDDGKGIPPERLSSPSAFGLIQIRERARSLNGRVDIESRPGGGTRIQIQIPHPPPCSKGAVS